ncbi:hypothetical protein RQP46_003688 [Phenoliferia psychrophenolica]
MESPTYLTAASGSLIEPMHLDAADPTPAPTTIADLPNETLNRILELVAEPIAVPTHWDSARTAADTLLAASLVSKRWQDLAGRVLEQNCCITLPFTTAQLESYTSRPRSLITSMVLRARPRDSLVGATRGLANFRGVKTLHLQAQFLLFLMTEDSSSFQDLRVLTLWGQVGKVMDFGDDSVTQTGRGLSHLSLNVTASKWGGILLQSAKSTLVDLEILAFFSESYFLPQCEFDQVRTLTISMASFKTPRWKPSMYWESPSHEIYEAEGAAGLAGFSAIKSLKLDLWIGPDGLFLSHPVLWVMSREMFDQTIATLPPSARLSQLSLPTGKLSTLDNLTPFLDEPVLHHLKELLLPQISRVLLDQRGFGRELLTACEERGIRVVFQEELALLETVR